jgi:hypothetical protein
MPFMNARLSLPSLTAGNSRLAFTLVKRRGWWPTENKLGRSPLNAIDLAHDELCTSLQTICELLLM